MAAWQEKVHAGGYPTRVCRDVAAAGSCGRHGQARQHSLASLRWSLEVTGGGAARRFYNRDAETLQEDPPYHCGSLLCRHCGSFQFRFNPAASGSSVIYVQGRLHRWVQYFNWQFVKRVSQILQLMKNRTVQLLHAATVLCAKRRCTLIGKSEGEVIADWQY